MVNFKNCRSSSLKSWNIYPERNGTITFKIRFGGHNDQQHNMQASAFKRKTVKQLNRDYIRSSEWHSRKQGSDKSEPGHPQQHASAQTNSGVQIRSMSKGAPEVIWSADTHLLNPLADPFPYSASSPNKPLPSPGMSDTSPISPQSLLSLTDNVTKNTLSVPPLEASVTLPDLPETAESVDISDSGSECSIPTQDGDIPDCRLQFNNCAYGSMKYGVNNFASTVYTCEKCEFDVCSDCISRGTHVRHRKYMRLK